jgi:hypothetical protein
MHPTQLERLKVFMAKRNMANANVRHIEGIMRMHSTFLGTLSEKQWDDVAQIALEEYDRLDAATREDIANMLGVAS